MLTTLRAVTNEPFLASRAASAQWHLLCRIGFGLSSSTGGF